MATITESRRQLPGAIATMKAAQRELDNVATELNDRPVLKDCIMGIALGLEEGVIEAGSRALELADDGPSKESLARQEVADVARAWVNRLPKGKTRKALVVVSALDQEDRVKAYDERETEPTDNLALAEIIAKRDKIEETWLAYEAPGVEDPDENDRLKLTTEEVELQARVLESITKGRVNPVDAAKAVLGTQRIRLARDES